MSFSRVGEAIEMPNLLEVQKKSFDWFLNEGLRDVLDDVSPIVDYSGNLVIEFVDYTIDSKTQYPVEECKERDVNYAESKSQADKQGDGRGKRIRDIQGRFPDDDRKWNVCHQWRGKSNRFADRSFPRHLLRGFH